jgi:hypothetical protein
MYVLTEFPDVEVALMFALLPIHPEVRFVTMLPAGDLTKVTARINRVSGTNRNIWVDHPVVDIDVWGFRTDPMDASDAARGIQMSLLALMGIKVQTGVIQHVTTVSGPRALPEVNPTLVRYNASYQVDIHP